MEDEELDLFVNKASRFKKFYIFSVFEKYGFAYGIIAIITFLCHVIIFLPAAAVVGFVSVEVAITKLSAGNKDLHDCLWAYLIVSLVAIIAIWLTNKICDKVLFKKKVTIK